MTHFGKSLLALSLFCATRVYAFDAAKVFKGGEALSPRAIVDEFSPWDSDKYPNLVTSLNVDAIAHSSNRLYCAKQEVLADSTVRCTQNEEVSESYMLRGLWPRLPEPAPQLLYAA